MNIGIITISQGCNYGNRLQMYAVQRVLEKLGHESYVIKNNTNVSGSFYEIKKRIKVAINYHGAKDGYLREKSFDKFDNKHITFYKEALDEGYQSSKIGEKLDAFLCGSDQVWNPYSPFLNGICFADFENVKKRFSYAASFGIEEIPSDKQEDFRQWLSKLDAVSVREESGAEIVRDLIGKEAEVLIDPTMMLDAEEWAQIEERPLIDMPSKFIFTYFLGEQDIEVKKTITLLSERYDMQIINILPEWDERNYKLNPSHFVYLLHHADVVITDSFHATVFAIIFQKPFRIFDRVSKKFNMSTRLDTLLSYFGLAEHRNNFDTRVNLKQNYIIDEILEQERIKAIQFLNQNIGE